MIRPFSASFAVLAAWMLAGMPSLVLAQQGGSASSTRPSVSGVASQAGVQQSTVKVPPGSSAPTTLSRPDDDEAPVSGHGTTAVFPGATNATLVNKARTKLNGMGPSPTTPAPDPNIVTLQALQVKVQTAQAQTQVAGDSAKQKMLQDLSVLLSDTIGSSSSGTVSTSARRQIQIALKGLQDAGVKGLPDPNTFAGPDDDASGATRALASYDNPADPETAGNDSDPGTSVIASSELRDAGSGGGSLQLQTIYGNASAVTPQNGSSVTQIASTQVAGGTKVITAPSTQVAMASTQVAGATKVVTAPTTQLAGPSSVMTAPSTQLVGPSSVMTAPSTLLDTPEADAPSLCGR